MIKIITILLISFSGLFAQQWTQYINSGFVKSLVSNNQYIYMGTYSGGITVMNKENEKMTFYNTANSRLPSNTIYSLTVNDNLLWIGTDSGLTGFDSINWTIYNTSNSGLPDNTVSSLAIDGDQLWVGTDGGGLASFDSTNWTVYNNLNSGLPSNSVSSLAIDGDLLWIGTSGGLASFDGTNWTIYNTELRGNISSLAVSDDLLWVGANGGIASFDSTTWTTYNISNSGLPSNSVSSLAVSDNLLWVGMYWYYGGVASFDGTSWALYSYFADLGQELPLVTSLAVDGDLLWMGTINGLASFDGTSWTIYNTSNSGLPNNTVSSLAVSNDLLWIGTRGGLAGFDGTNWTVYNPTNSRIPYLYVSSLAVDEDQLWVGTDGGGLASFDSTNWTTYNTSNSGLLSNTVSSLTVDDNILWVGTTSGLLKFDKTIYLPSVAIVSVTDIDTSGAIIVGTADNLGNPKATQHGFCWNTDGELSLEDHSIELGPLDSTGLFSAQIAGLTANTIYYIRAYATNEAGTRYSETISFTSLETGIQESIPSNHWMSQNFPNPFNPTTTLKYGLLETSDITLNIFDITGRKIKQWSISSQQAGWHEVIWDGTDMNGNIVSTGVYIYMMQAGDFIDTKKMVFMK